MSFEVCTEELPQGEYAPWEALVAASPDGGIYNEPAYLDVLCRAAGGRFRVLVARHGEELLGGVALYERDSRFGVYVTQRLLLYFNGLVLKRWETRYPSIETGRQLACQAALADHIERLGYGSVCLRSAPTVSDARPFLVRGWLARPTYTYIVPLTELEAQWRLVEQNLRRLVRRCTERDRLECTEDDDFGSFYRLHVQTLARHDVAPYLPERAFRGYFQALHAAGKANLYHARLPDGRAIASQLVLLAANRTSSTVSAGTDPEFLQLGAQAFLRWRAFEALAVAGYVSNDLTDASLNPVTHFKAQLGGELEMSLVLQSRQSRRYALGKATERAWRRTRGGVGRGVRRLLGRRAS